MKKLYFICSLFLTLDAFAAEINGVTINNSPIGTTVPAQGEFTSIVANTIGISSTNTGPKLDIIGIFNSPTTKFGIRNSNYQNGNGVLYGIQNYITHAGAISAAAMDNKVLTIGSGSRDHIVGFQNLTQHSSTGTLNQMVGYYTHFLVSDIAGPIGQAVNFLAESPAITYPAQITSTYGIFIQDQSHTQILESWGIYQEGRNTLNSLRGRLSIGENKIPEAQLDLVADGIDVLRLEQSGTAPFTKLVGAAGANTIYPISTLTNPGVIAAFEKVDVNGTIYWRPLYTAPY